MGRVRAASHDGRGHTVAHHQRRAVLARLLRARLRLVYSFGFYYIYKLLHEGPTSDAKAIPGATGRRPMAFADRAETATGSTVQTGG